MPAGLAPMTMKRIQREISDLKKEDLGNIVLEPTDNLQVWRGIIPGPEGSVYEGGVFQVEIALPNDYPFTAPKVVFKTRIYHMNISEQGGICIDILKNNWSPALSLFKVMLSLSSLLTDPNPKDPLVPSVATQYVRSRKLHDATAREWTDSYAKPPAKPVPQRQTQVIPRPVPDLEPIVATSPIPIVSATRPTRTSRRRGDPAPAPSTSALPSSASTSVATDEVIVLDSDEERSSSRAMKRKRKVGHVDEDAGHVLNLIDSDEESDRKKAAGKKPRTQTFSSRTSGDGVDSSSGPSGSSRNQRNPGRLSDVIVIDD